MSLLHSLLPVYMAICSRYQVNRRRVIPLPLYKADPKKHQSALFKKEQVRKETVDMIDFLSNFCPYFTSSRTPTHGSDYFTQMINLFIATYIDLLYTIGHGRCHLVVPIPTVHQCCGNYSSQVINYDYNYLAI